jgi:hypothetical protein
VYYQPLLDGIKDLRQLFRDWHQEHDRTGRWPVGEIASWVGLATAFGIAMVVIMVLQSRYWPKDTTPTFGLFAVVFIAAYLFTKRIRSARLKRRLAARKHKLSTEY